MTYRMEDGTVVNTDKARQTWDEERFWDGRNHISKATGTQFNHETLYESRKGRFYVVHSSDYQGSRDHTEWVSEERAAAWLIANGHQIPEALKAAAEEVEE